MTNLQRDYSDAASAGRMFVDYFDLTAKQFGLKYPKVVNMADKLDSSCLLIIRNIMAVALRNDGHA